jgi:Zn-dependent protease
VHLDPIGTVLIPLLGALSGLPLIGWAKPVPFNPYNLRYQKWGPVMVALAGPVSNFLFAAVYLAILKIAFQALGLPFTNLLVIFLILLVMINIALGIFNFIPVPPLDGSKLAYALLDSPKHRRIVYFLETRGPVLLLALVFIDFALPFSFLGRLFRLAIDGAFALAGLGSLSMMF